MRTVQYFNPKTINIDSDIFTQENSLRRSKLPLQLLKSLAQKKRINRRNTSSRGDRYASKLSKTKLEQANDQIKSESSLNFFHQPIKTIEIYTSKENNKTNPQNGKRRGFNHTVNNFMRKNQAFFNKNDQESLFNNLRETRQSLKNKMLEKNQKAKQQQIQFQSLNQNHRTINPYTNQQYSYITYKEHDQLIQIKKAQRFRRMSSITKSYKIVTLQLASPQHYRRPSVQYSPGKMFSPSKNKPQTKKQMPRKQVDIISPSPWQWGLQQSKDLLQ